MGRAVTARVFLLGCMSVSLGCGDDDLPSFGEDGSFAHDADAKTSSTTTDPPGNEAGMADDGATPGGPVGGSSSPFSDAGMLPRGGSVCTLGVGAECDGPEDCPVPQSCCAVFDPLRLRYTSIGCALNCDQLNQFELCHPSQQCKRGRTCRRSAVVPHDFITVCADPGPFPTQTTSEEVVDRVLCGADQCVVGVEQCCLRSEFQFASLMSVPLEPYCAPIGSECNCSSEPPGMDEDGGMVPGG